MHECFSKSCDFNLYMVQTGTAALVDVRVRQIEVHAFGWKQESSESQSTLINQSWSLDGWYMSSGSADPMIHIFETQQVLATDGLNAYLNNRTSMYRIELDPQLKLLLEGKFPCFEMLDPSMYIICRHIVENLDEVHQC
ncbi:unnamed protein product [Miscanthus lutarioriparius]|uniref:Uncharacterized protein n=1 Tax=Miscanthus lutarioriparius TaxID=422564 RepID=A0A811QVF9_9POAL|nr:unnamed protein product [Miscanthus lutarioriparius]